jgi:hypothetical protein
VVHDHYTTVNMVRTIEDVLGIGHLNLNDEYQQPMTNAFDLHQSAWTYQAVVPAPIAAAIAPHGETGQLGAEFQDAHPAAYWARLTRGFDWSTEDRIPTALFNQILWKGLAGDLPYPSVRSHADYSPDREEVLKTRSIRFLYQEP